MRPNIFTYCIVDDNQVDVNALDEQLSKIPYLKRTATFNDPLLAVRELPAMDTDFLFLDVDMPGMLGTDLLRLLSKPPVTILCTAFDEFYAEGFELNVADYLKKPVSFERLLKAVQKAVVRLGMRASEPGGLDLRNDYLALPIGDGRHRFFKTQDINYLRANDHYTKLSVIHPSRAGEEVIEIKKGLGEIVNHLPPDRFFRVSRSEVVPIDRIKETLDSGFVVLSIPDGKRISISQTRRAELMRLVRGC